MTCLTSTRLKSKSVMYWPSQASSASVSNPLGSLLYIFIKISILKKKFQDDGLHQQGLSRLATGTSKARASFSMLSRDMLRMRRSTCATNVLCSPASYASSSCEKRRSARRRTRLRASSSRADGSTLGVVVGCDSGFIARESANAHRLCQPLLSHNIAFFGEVNMFVTFPVLQVECPPDYQDEGSAWDLVVHTNQQGWFNVVLHGDEPSVTTETALMPYPLGINQIANFFRDKNIAILGIQCALFNEQLKRWSLYAVTEIFHLRTCTESEDVSNVFRLEDLGLLDSAGHSVKLKPGDNLQLIYQESQG